MDFVGLSGPSVWSNYHLVGKVGLDCSGAIAIGKPMSEGGLTADSIFCPCLSRGSIII